MVANIVTDIMVLILLWSVDIVANVGVVIIVLSASVADPVLFFGSGSANPV